MKVFYCVYNHSFMAFLLIAFIMVFFFTIPILTQDKSEVKDEQISQSSNDDCKELIKLQDALETLKKALSGANIKGKKTIPVYIKKCETELMNVKKDCPLVDASLYEEELSKYKKQWEKEAFQLKVRSQPEN